MAEHKKSKALSEREGSVPSSNLSPHTEQFRKSRLELTDVSALVDKLKEGDTASLSRAITLVESTASKHLEVAEAITLACLPHSGKAVRIGITGVPGVGKSTFIERLGMLLVDKGHRIAVLAVDPSSTVSQGSILGDKTRMEQLSAHSNAYIRPSPSGKSLGGVARKTRESMILCEAAGFDIILVETVGVGQSETAVHSMTDFFLLLKLAGAGDELQGIKRGIIEMADAIVINKADGENLKAAKQAKTEFNRALHLYPARSDGWRPATHLCSAENNEGIEEIWTLINSYFEAGSEKGYFEGNRAQQNEFWLRQTIEDHLKTGFFGIPSMENQFIKQLQLIQEQKTTPFSAARYLINLGK